MMFTILGNGSIQTDSIDDALALAARMRTPQAAEDRPLATAMPPEPPPTERVTKKKTTAKKAPAVAEPGAKRAYGTGNAFMKGDSWCWSVGAKEERQQKAGFATKELALAALDVHLRGEKPAPKEEASEDEPEAPEPILTSNPAYIHPGADWGPVDEAGLSKCLRCSGRGTGCAHCDRAGLKRCEPANRKLSKPGQGFASSFPSRT